MEVAGRPDAGDVSVPEAVRRLAAARDIDVVWRNELGGLSFRLEAPTAPST